ncbi:MULTISPECIES: PstS family phosphate ABC transporter substrate-binding protein [Micrococcaceae]|uniref:PstS family phosphate ABC transporter substrate-binding protein n=1 Tax=Micrococcaceae TaxID=1268 RepID=UPI00286C710C|nr:PstS family phosphate ABC transporter substrate-binding protein [Citricoccus sp. I39-566]WMY77442.1 PstS family phosphate ABC transporter substrate-binding protein [Citricoccus sp. I39-566]
MKNALRGRTGLAVLGLSALLLTGCGSAGSTDNTSAAEGGATEAGGVSGAVAVDGSSTVAPLSEAAAEQYRQTNESVNVSVATSGTGGGFKKFCAGETDISNASRPIKEEEIAECEANGIEYTEVVMANDGLSVVANPANDWAQCLTVEQLQTIWGPESEGQVMSWKDVDPSFPDEPLDLYGAGTDSGTFDYFTEAINGEEGAIRTDYSPSEDDNVTVQGVSGSPGALGFLGLSYALENPDTLKLLDVDGGEGCITPSEETVQDGSYAPLGRPLFIYVANASYQDKPQVQDFVDFYVENSTEIAQAAQFIGLTDEQMQKAQDQLAELN